MSTGHDGVFVLHGRVQIGATVQALLRLPQARVQAFDDGVQEILNAGTLANMDFGGKGQSVIPSKSGGRVLSSALGAGGSTILARTVNVSPRAVVCGRGPC